MLIRNNFVKKIDETDGIEFGIYSLGDLMTNPHNNQILSEKQRNKKSRIPVYNPTDDLKKFKIEYDFMVHEGDWDEFYGSRIEVWFQPENRNLKERKLFSKNYIIQGWQR